MKNLPLTKKCLIGELKEHETTNNLSGSVAGIGGSVCVNRLWPVEAGGGGMRDTIDMAREAGDDWDSTLSTDKEFLKRFQALVRADEREEFQRWFDAVTAQHKQEILAEILSQRYRDTTPPAQPAPVQEPVAQLGDGVLWCDTCRSVTASTHHSNPNDRDVWCEGEAKWLQGPFYTTPPAQPAVPDAIGPNEDELPAYAAGRNDCRQAMLEMMK